MVTFNDSSLLQGLVQHVRFLSGQSNLSIENATRLLNFAVDDYSSIVLSCDGKWKFEDSTNTDTPIGYTQVTAGQRNYTLDTNFLKIERVEIKYQGNWTVVEPIDQRDYKDQSLEQVYSEPGVPKYYDYDGQQIKLYPSPSWSDGGDNTVIANNSLKVDHSRPANYFDTTDTTATIGIPRIHHRYLTLKAAKEVMMASNDPSITSVNQELVAWEGQEIQGRLSGGKIREYFSTRDENTPRRLKPVLNSAFTSRFNRLRSKN